MIAKYLKKYGFNTDFAPMADTYSNKENTVIGTRAYSDDYKQSAVLIEKAVRGFDKYNMITCLKHFPGHGDTKEDSHQTIAHTKKSLNEIKGEELLPFYSGIKAGADMVMVGHIAVDSLDKNLPSSINKDIVSGLIRNEMGFNGVIITDSLSMDSVKNIKDLSLKAVMAGNDMLLMPENIREAVKSIEEAVKSGNISEEQIDKSVERILKMKYNNGIISF
ncbi:MAG: glycoside hydrolase family 3 protein [Acutalibacteraceae bacterium]